MEMINKKHKYFDVEVRLNEAEIQTILSVFEEDMVRQQYRPEDLIGLRKEIYMELQNIIKSE